MIDSVPAPRVSGKAVVSLVLGLLAVPLSLVAGIPALVVGFVGLREINGSDGRLRGRWLAVAGMALGGMSVVFVLAMGTAMLVWRQREAAQRLACQNNLRQLGMAVGAYFNDHQALPPGTVANADLPPERRLSWVVSLLPYFIEPASRRGAAADSSRFGKLYERIDRQKAWDDPANAEAVNEVLSRLLCPARRGALTEDEPGLTDYVGIAGLGARAAELPLSSPDAGAFGYDRIPREKDVKDIGSTTLVAAETRLDVGPWAAGGRPTVRGFDPVAQPYFGPAGQFGGLHRGVTNVLFLDGSVQPAADSTLPRVIEMWACLHREPDEQ